MLAAYWMSPWPASLSPSDSISRAARLMREHGLECLPVVEEGLLTGMLAGRDLRRASVSQGSPLEVSELAYLLSRVKVKDVMTPRPVVVNVLDTVESAAMAMLRERSEVLPVVDSQGRVMGMLTHDDLLRALVHLTGAAGGGVVLALEADEGRCLLPEAAQAVGGHGGRLAAMLTSQRQAPAGRRRVYLRAQGLSLESLPGLRRDLAALGYLSSAGEDQGPAPAPGGESQGAGDAPPEHF